MKECLVLRIRQGDEYQTYDIDASSMRSPNWSMLQTLKERPFEVIHLDQAGLAGFRKAVREWGLYLEELEALLRRRLPPPRDDRPPDPEDSPGPPDLSVAVSETVNVLDRPG